MTAAHVCKHFVQLGRAPLRRRCTPPRAGVPTRTRRWRAGQRRRAAPTSVRPTPHALPLAWLPERPMHVARRAAGAKWRQLAGPCLWPRLRASAWWAHLPIATLAWNGQPASVCRVRRGPSRTLRHVGVSVQPSSLNFSRSTLFKGMQQQPLPAPGPGHTSLCTPASWLR